MSIALLVMCRDEFKPVKDIIKSVKGICEEKIIVELNFFEDKIILICYGEEFQLKERKT